MSKIIWLVLAVAVIGVAYFVFIRQGGPLYQATSPSPSPAPAQALPTAVSADPDVFVAGLVSNVQQELMTPEEADPSFLTVNDQAISDFDQSSNPNQF